MKQGSAYFKEEFSELDCVTIDQRPWRNIDWQSEAFT